MIVRWTDPVVLFLGLALAVVVALAWARYERRRRWALDQFAGRLAGRLAHAEPDRQRAWRWGLRLAALVLLAIAAAGPRWGEEVVRVTAQGSDVAFVFDTSASMDTRDVPPSRLEEARREALSLLDGMAGDRVALIAFAGDAVALSPLTLDGSAVRLLIETLGTGTLSTPGTDLGRGLRTALRVLPEGNPGEQAIVLFTDGEDLEGGLSAAGALAQRRGVRVFAVGVGTPAGQTIPLLDAGGRQVGVKTDAAGQPVVSRLDAPALQDLARRTHGQYFAADHPGGDLGRLKAALGSVGKGAREGRLGARPIERFHWFALAAWLCLVASWLLPERRRAWGRRPAAVAGLVLWLPLLAAGLALSPAAAQAANPLVEGNRLYAKADFRGAVRVYQEGLKAHPQDAALWTNLGSALYRLNDFSGAERAFARARSQDPRIEAQADYGRGNALFRQQRWRDAMTAYRQSLEKEPGDPDARFNYELALRKLRAEQQKQNPQPPPPQQGAGGGGGGGGQPPPAQPQQSGSPPPAGSPQPRTGQPREAGAVPGQLTREQAERLLDALAADERDARNTRRARPVEPPSGKDW